jgi:hypothetical protein
MSCAPLCLTQPVARRCPTPSCWQVPVTVSRRQVHDWEVADAVTARTYDWTLDDQEDEDFVPPYSDGAMLAKMWGQYLPPLALASAPVLARGLAEGQPSDHVRRSV